MYLVFLVLSVVSRSSFINARPASVQASWISTNPGASNIYRRDEQDPHNYNLRTMSEIVWSCLLTIFACSWVSVHPNIPSPRDSDSAIFRRRIRLMFWAIIAPELLMIWAMRQWLQAKNLAKIYEDRGWTRMHGHFLIMGGFMLYKDGIPTQTLSIEKFHKHLEAGSIEFPNITKEDIADRSKGDLFSRCIVMIQVAWFSVQCMARSAQGLTITELEIVTLAFTTLNGAMYAFWWDKPLDVRRAVRIDFQVKPTPITGQSSKVSDPEVDTRADLTPEPEQQADSIVEASGNPKASDRFKLIVDEEDWVYMGILRDYQRNRQQSHPDATPPPLKLRFTDKYSEVAKYTRDAFKHPVVSAGEYIKKEGLLSALFDVFVTWPTKYVLNGLGDIVESDDSRKVSGGALRVPMFYAPMMVPDTVVWVRAGAAVLGVVFGSIHLAAWSGTFATHGEQTAWRISSLIITIIPAIILVANILSYFLDRSEPWNDGCFGESVYYIEYLVGAGGILVYVPSRITLFVIAFICLGSIPPDGFQKVNWMAFIPHIS